MRFSTLKDYLGRTEKIRNSVTELFISTRKPHKGVTTGTLARWMKSMLRAAGIDTNVYTAHSFRSASTSTAFAQGVSLQDILHTADWTNASTFARFYNKQTEDSTFAASVLSAN